MPLKVTWSSSFRVFLSILLGLKLWWSNFSTEIAHVTCGISENFSSVFSKSLSLSLFVCVCELYPFFCLAFSFHLRCQCVNVTLHRGNICETVCSVKSTISLFWTSTTAVFGLLSWSMYIYNMCCIELSLKHKHLHRHRNRVLQTNVQIPTHIHRNIVVSQWKTTCLFQGKIRGSVEHVTRLEIPQRPVA